MKLVCCSIVFGLCLLGLLTDQAKAIELLYDFEGDSGTVAHDKLTSDGAQNGVTYNNVILNNTTDPGWGKTAFIDNPPTPPENPFSTFEIPESTFGTSFSLTMGAWVNQDQVNRAIGRFRVFSSFVGGGAVPNNVLLLDAANGGGGSSLRGIVGGIQFNAPAVVGTLSPGYHHYAMTIDGTVGGNSSIKLYVDGVSQALTSTGTLSTYSNNVNLRLGEDVRGYPQFNTLSEQLVGNMDDAFVIQRALSPTSIASIYAAGVGSPVSNFVTPVVGERAVYYDFEGDSGNSATDKFTLDGSQNSTGTALAAIDSNPANAKVGGRSASFADPQPPTTPGSEVYSQINTGVTGSLGQNFTISAVVNPYSTGQILNGVARIFSSYAGTGSTAGSLILDFNPSSVTGIRLYLPSNTNAATLTIPGAGQLDLVTTTAQTLTITYETGATNDAVRVYRDGVLIGSKLDLPPGTVQSLGTNELRIGEDRGGYKGAYANENYTGSIDDVLILGRALTPAQVLQLHNVGAAALLATLTVPGDYNKNGVVDAADYVVWRKSSGQTGAGLAADGNGDSVVNNLDYDYWRTRFGNTGGAGSGVSASTNVPEPTAIAMLSVVLASAVFVRRRTR